ncbi:MAG TPA: PRC-barrel domain-containing protein [Terriglobales bacterium]|nr:PRC-barrel domain-containing protein [Terriglobales bacterium]
MLRSIKEMLECNLTAKDGDFGRIDDVFLDDKNWSIRYLVVDTAKWLPDRKLLIPFPGTSKLDWSELIFPLSLTRQEVLNKYVRGVIGKYVRFGK